MYQYVGRRLFQLIPVVIGVSIIVFLIMHLTPGDPVALMFGADAAANPELMASLRHQMGLDQPLYVQYLRFLGNLSRGDLGRSLTTNDRVVTEIFARLPATLEISVCALVISVLVGLLAGIIAAVRRNSAFDYVSTMGAFLGASLPSFWFGLMLIYTFAVSLQLFPVSGRGGPLISALIQALTGDATMLKAVLPRLVLPSITLGLPSAALVARLTRSSMLEVLSQDFVRTARSKGLSERAVVYRHALKNALIPVVTMVGLQFGYLLGGAVITESVFAWPGIGRLVVLAIQQRDYPVVQGNVMALALIFVLINLLVDLTYGLLDPRIRYQ